MSRFLYYVTLTLVSIASIFNVLGFLGESNWFFDLFSHFKIQYLIIIGSGTTLMLLLRRKVAFLFLPLIAFLSYEVFSIYIRTNNKEDLNETSSICSINLLSSNGEFEDVKNYLRSKEPDIIILQEFTSLWEIKLEPILSHYEFKISIPRNDNFGIALYSKKDVKNLKTLNIGDAGVPSISGDLVLNNNHVKIIASHPLPPVGQEYFELRNSQLNDLAELIAELNNDAILVGDLNTSSYSAHFKMMMSNSGLIDTREGFGHLTSWPTWFEPASITLDHCLISKNIFVKSREVGPHIGSDHLPIYIELAVK